MEEYLVYQTVNQIKLRGGLTNEEIATYFKNINNQQEKGVALENIPERAILILVFRELIFYVIKKLGADMSDYNIYQEGLIGLIRAIDNYDYEKNIKFITFASTCIKNEILSYLRCINRFKYKGFVELSLEESTKNESDIKYKDIIPDDYDLVEDYAHKDMLCSYMKYLRPIEQYCLVFGEGLLGKNKLTQMKLSQVLGCTHSSISNYQIRAKYKLFLLMSTKGNLTERQRQDRDKIMLKTYKVLDFNCEVDIKNLID